MKVIPSRRFIALVTCLVFSTAVAAQSATNAKNQNGVQRSKVPALAEITVIANRRTENIQNVPISITSVSAHSLAAAAVTGTSDLQVKVPALNFEILGSGFQPFIRGVGTAATGAGSENSVAVYVDGVYITALEGGLLALNNIERIEVDKGPQGTLFGRNTTGGVINIITRTPSHHFHAKMQLDYGDYQTVSTSDYITGGITPTLAADVAVYYRHQGQGYGRNLTTGNEIGGDQEAAIRTKWLFTPTDRDSITAEFDYERTDNSELYAQRIVSGSVMNWGTGTTLASQRPDLAPYLASPSNPTGLYPTAIVGSPTLATPGGPHDINGATDPKIVLAQGGASLTATHDFDFAQLVSITAYRKDKNTVDNIPVIPVPEPVETYGWLERNLQFSQELRLVSRSGPVKWVGGLYFLRADVAYKPFYLLGSSLFPLQSIDFNGDQETKSYAAYGQTTIPLSFIPATDVTLGVRYTEDKKSITGDQVYTFMPFLAFLDSTTGFVNAHKTFNKVTYRLALTHHFTNDVMGYISYNRGFKSGSYNMVPAGGTPVKPEILDAYELGVKNDLMHHRIRLNAAAFYYKWSDMQVTTFLATSAITTNAARAELYGLDLDAGFAVSDRLTVSASATLLKDHFLQYADAQYFIPVPYDAATNTGGGNTVVAHNAAGNRLPWAPDATVSLSANYTVPLSRGSLVFSPTYYYNSGFYTYAQNNSFEEVHHYQLVNARVRWNAPNGTTTISLWGKNLLDTTYASGVFAQGNPGGGYKENIAPPRTFGVEIQQDF